MKLATITIYGVNWSCGGCETKRRDDDRYEGSIAKPSICIGQRLDADFPWYCQPIWEMMISVAMVLLFLSLFLFLSTYLRALLSTILGILETLFERQTPTNSIRVSREQIGYMLIRRIIIIPNAMGLACQYIFIRLLHMESATEFFQHSNFFYFHKQGN